jgi:hypothetical protein
VSRAITPYAFQVDSVLHPTNAPTQDVIASLIGALENPESLPAILQHLWHEWEVLQAAVLVQRR